MPVREAEQSPHEHPCLLIEAPRSHINATLNTGLCSYNHMVIFVHLSLQPQVDLFTTYIMPLSGSSCSFDSKNRHSA